MRFRARCQQAIGFYQFIEDVLQDVFYVRSVWHAGADEVSQTSPLLADDLGDLSVLLVHECDTHRINHLFL